MHYKILLIIFFAFISKSYATEVNGNFKDECKYLKTQIEKDIAFLSEDYTGEFEAASVMNKVGLKGMVNIYMTLCD